MPLSVLVVNDVPDIVDSAVLVLDLSGFAARGAYSGADALAKATVAMPDVVLTDLGMPVMDGVALIREFRRRSGPRRLVLIAETAYSDEVRRRQAIEAGADEVLCKPVEPARLVGLLRRYEAEMYPPGESVSRPG